MHRLHVSPGQLVRSSVNGASFSKGEVFKVKWLVDEGFGSFRFACCQSLQEDQPPLYFRPQEIEPLGG